MDKRNYKLTPSKYGFKVEVIDKYGTRTTVYEKTILDASKFIMNYWEKSEERKLSNNLMNKAITNCVELDEKYGILKGNRDGLD
tara:strand:+ start:290 stop:541 length:252 start_codon:yes stop_codon:yes gene_type:complete